MLTLSHVSKSYGKFPAVEDISLEMEHGLYGMLAPNGAGKTTLIKMIATLLVPTQGEILWDGIPVAKLGEKYRDLLGYLPQQFGYYKNNTPVQYLDYLAALKNMPKQTAKEKIEQLLELVGLSDVADKKMKKFSGGMIQRVGIAQAMLNDPKILILDEPTAGLDPKERARFRNILSTLSKDRIVILSTHIVSDIESNANQVILLKERKLYRMDTVSNICKTLDGKVYECVMEDRAFDAFQDTHLILSVRQEQEHMQVRYYSSKPEEGSRNCTPNLEDVFLVVHLHVVGVLLDVGDDAVFVRNRCVEEVADHNPAQEVGEEHHGLVSLLEELSGNLVHHDGEGHGNDHAQNDEHDVVGQRIADHDPRGVSLEQELEILESHPFTVDQIADKGGIAGVDLVILERQHDTAHGQVTQQQQPDRHGSNHGQKYQSFLVLLKPARGRGSWLQTFGGFCSHSLFTHLS